MHEKEIFMKQITSDESEVLKPFPKNLPTLEWQPIKI